MLRKPVGNTRAISSFRTRIWKSYLNPSKCNLFRREINFLEHFISTEYVSADPKKIFFLENWRHPEDVRHLKLFFGSCTCYRKFVKSFSSFARPLHKLTEAWQKFSKTDKCVWSSFYKTEGTLTSLHYSGVNTSWEINHFWTQTPATKVSKLFCHSKLTVENYTLME